MEAAISGNSAANFNANVPPVEVERSTTFFPNFLPIATASNALFHSPSAVNLLNGALVSTP